jgi:transposase
MSDLYWLTDEQMARLKPRFPKSHGKPRVDDPRVWSGIIVINRNGLRWRDVPAADGSHKTLHNRWKRWSEAGVFVRMMEGLSGAQAGRRTVTITRPISRRTAGLRACGKKGGLGRLIGRRKSGVNTKLHALTDANGRPISLFMTAGQVSGYAGAAALLDSLPRAQWLLGDGAMTLIGSVTPSKPRALRPASLAPNPTELIRHDKRRYKRRTASRSCSCAGKTGGGSPLALPHPNNHTVASKGHRLFAGRDRPEVSIARASGRC